MTVDLLDPLRTFQGGCTVDPTARPFLGPNGVEIMLRDMEKIDYNPASRGNEAAMYL